MPKIAGIGNAQAVLTVPVARIASMETGRDSPAQLLENARLQAYYAASRGDYRAAVDILDAALALYATTPSSSEKDNVSVEFRNQLGELMRRYTLRINSKVQRFPVERVFP